MTRARVGGVLLVAVGAVVVLASLFTPWYDAPEVMYVFGALDRRPLGGLSGFEAFHGLR
jgi:hypothetical protein